MFWGIFQGRFSRERGGRKAVRVRVAGFEEGCERGVRYPDGGIRNKGLGRRRYGLWVMSPPGVGRRSNHDGTTTRRVTGSFRGRRTHRGGWPTGASAPLEEFTDNGEAQRSFWRYGRKAFSNLIIASTRVTCSCGQLASSSQPPRTT